MRVAIASDHAGFDLKNLLLPILLEAGYECNDLGTYDSTPTDYPDHARSMAETMQAGQADRGIIICGSGVGVCVAVNKFKGIRAGVCHDTYSAHQSVEHDNANVLCLGSRIIGPALMKELSLAFLHASFSEEERHVKRLKKIEQIEQHNFK